MDRSQGFGCIRFNGTILVSLIERKCTILVGSAESRFYLLYHDPAYAVDHIAPMDIGSYFVHVVTLQMKHFVSVACDNLRSKGC